MRGQAVQGFATRYATARRAGEATIVDTLTQLQWQPDYTIAASWQWALSYCEGLVLAGFDDWRLPDRNELATLTDYSTINPASRFPGMPSQPFWTSTSVSSSPAFGWYVFFYNSEIYGFRKHHGDVLVRCVR